ELQSLITDTSIKKVGVFVNESIEYISRYLSLIDMIQLHGKEDNDFIKALNNYTDKKIIKAFKIRTEYDITAAQNSMADHILLDSGEGSGKLFNHDLLNSIEREYFLAGGLSPENIEEVLKKLSPYAVDVSSGIETNGRKDTDKMKAFANAVRRIT
ncbi:MAG: phosphoribosylanthranilate isomerase, partial [Clostridia bacterium]|nr:phosphoribosylanthranilate isomerase [Clostridia bacterium]